MHYLKVQVLPSHGLNASAIQSLLATVCHCHFGEQKTKFAFAYPEGNWGEKPHLGKITQVFAETPEALDSLYDAIEKNPRLEVYFKLGRIRPCPTEAAGYVAYQRYRVPSFRNKRPEQLEAQRRRRQARMEEKETYPFLQMRSISNQNQFSIFLARKESTTETLTTLETDSYGLSHPSSPTWLPVL